MSRNFYCYECNKVFDYDNIDFIQYYHLTHGLSTYHVCHTCKVKPNVFRPTEEQVMIAKNFVDMHKKRP